MLVQWDQKLWNVFINDLLLMMLCDIFNYADDNILAEIDEDVKEVMRCLRAETLKCIKQFNDTLIQANLSKFRFMLMDRKYIHKIILNLEPQESVKLLGFRIDRTLKFDKHIDTICKCTCKQLMYYNDYQRKWFMMKKYLYQNHL